MQIATLLATTGLRDRIVAAAGVSAIAGGQVAAGWSSTAGFACSAVGALILAAGNPTTDRRRRAAYLTLACSFIFAASPAHVACALFAPVLAFAVWPRDMPASHGVRRALVVGLAVAVPSIALILLWWSAQPSIVFYEFLPRWFVNSAPAWAVVIVCCTAAALNATWGELLWRCVLPRSVPLHSATWRVVSIVVLSALFGLAHIHSLPGGPLGVIMTTAFAIVAHVLAQTLSRGIVAAVLAHFLADAVLLILITLGPSYG